MKDKSNSPARDFALDAKSVRMCKGPEESGLFAEGRHEIYKRSFLSDGCGKWNEKNEGVSR